MIQRTIRETTFHVISTARGWELLHKVVYCESTIAGGRMVTHHDRYDSLGRQELSDLLEHLGSGPVAGEEFRGAGLQLSLI